MQPSTTDKAQISFLLPDLECQLDPRNPLFRLARAMDWSVKRVSSIRANQQEFL
jgi:hypothetical protein